jgi:soluble lytic murein transglycosylase
MKRLLRVVLGLGLGAAIFACSFLPVVSPQSPSASNTPGPTPTFTASPIPTPTQTPVPIVRVGSGDKALFDGDVDTAMSEYRAAVGDTTDPNIKAAALWGLARAQYEDARYADAVATLNQLNTDYPNSPYLAAANFEKGQCFSAMQRPADAAAAYQAYLSARPNVLDSYVQELRGDALSEATNYSDALSAYTAAQTAPHLDDAQALQIKIAQTHAKIGDYASALSMYNDIATNTTNDYTKAQMDYLAGEAYTVLNQKDQAYSRFEHAVENYPLSYYSYLGLIELVNANVKVSDLDRGLTDYFAGQYDVAVTSLDRYIAANPANDGTAHYYRAYALENLQKYQEAVDEFTYFIQHYSSNPKWADAWDEKSAIQWTDLNLYPDAAQTLLDYVKAAPSSSQAPDALMTAARILERDGRFDQAGEIWQRVSTEYPGYSQASTAVFFAGIMQYRQADYGAALPLIERSLVQATAPEDQARAYLWIGKTQEKLGSAADKESAWQQAQNADPGGYYSERASDLLMGHAPFTPPAKTNLNPDLTAERKAADSWMRLTFSLPADTDLSGLGALASDPRMIRGRELWELGEYEDAHLEFEDLRNSISSDAVSTYRLANYLLDLGDYFSGISAIRQVLTLAGLDDQTKSMLAPAYFNHVRYGLYYSDLIVPAAQKNGFDPLFLFSVVRQESLFEGFISSTAGAQGLMQIVPGTGAGIANSLGWPINYGPEQLYRPNVSIAFGTYYLASNRSSVHGDLYAALSAYNGGLGNALDWQKLSQGDPDLFLESVRFQETRDYIRSIYELFNIYSRLYGVGS